MTPDQPRPFGNLPPKHLPGTGGARDVETRTVRLARKLLADVVAVRGVGLFAGRPGTGKSFSLLSALASVPVPVLYWEPGLGLTLKGVQQSLLELLGIPYEPRWTSARLDGLLRKSLAGREFLLVVEEAARIGHAGLEELRYLQCQPDAQWSLLLVGSDLETLLRRNPALDSRIARRVVFRRMNRSASIAFARAYHQLFAEAATDLLDRIERVAKGIIRIWARTLEACLSILRRRKLGHLTVEVVAAALGITRGLES